MSGDPYTLLGRLYRGSTEPYEKSIGAHPSFARLRELWVENDIFKINPIAPYPISDKTITQSGYNSRPQTEARIFEGVAPKTRQRILIIIGPEGCGKSTALHYTIGRKFPDEQPDNFSNAAFALFDVKDWLSHQTPDQLLEHIVSQIRLKFQVSPFVDLISHFNQFREAAELQALKSVTINLTRDALEGFLAYLSLGAPDMLQAQQVALIFDNIDTVGKAQQISLFKAIQTLSSSIESYRRFIIHATQCKSIENFQFVLSMRPETSKALFSNSTGYTSWPPSEHVQKADLTDQKDLNPWRLAQSRIESMDLLKDSEKHEMRIALNIGVARLEESIRDPRSYVIGMTDWLDTNYPEATRELKRFCGKSIRRRMMFALKIIGHPHIRLAYYDERMRRMKNRVSKDVLYDAMYDFMQPLGEHQLFDCRAFLLNPFFVLDNRSALVRAPLLGINTLFVLDAHRTSDNVNRGEIFQKLLSVGYEKPMIDEALLSFGFSGLLRPVFADGPDVPSSYDIDMDLLSKYMEIVTAANPRETYFFVSNAIRQVLDLNSYVPADHPLEKCHLSLIFLDEVKEAVGRLHRLMLDHHSGDRQSVVDLHVRNYAKVVGVPLFSFVNRIVDDFGRSVDSGSVKLSRDMREKWDDVLRLRSTLRKVYLGFMPINIGGYEG